MESLEILAHRRTQQRGTSHFDFKTATTGVAAKAMRNEISQLVATVDDPGAKKVARFFLRSLCRFHLYEMI
jgi:hypothetical protein